MGFGRWLSEHIGEIVLFLLLGIMMPMVFFGFLLPTDYRVIMIIPAFLMLILLFIVIGILAIAHRLQLMMGLRNLIRHKSDTVIAILGFMIGTSIICSSLAIGDTMSNMIETLVYDAYDLRDEFMVVTDQDGGNYLFNGTQANNISDAVWSINEEEQLIDGVSWELHLQGSIINRDTELFEPVINFMAYSTATEDSFGSLMKDGNDIDFSLGENEIYITRSVSELVEGEPGHRFLVSTGEGQRFFTVKDIVDDEGRAGWSGNSIFFNFHSLWNIFNITNVTAETPGADRDWSGGYYNILFVSNEGGKVDGGEHCPQVVDSMNEKFLNIPHPVDPGKNLEVTGDKKSNVDNAKNAMSQFTTMFLALGTFSIIAGITLIINIFVMLSEERKEEMGISRAVGMKRRHLRMVYLFEGTAYSFISSFVGVILGAVTGFLIIFAVERIIESVAGSEFQILQYYSVSPFSLILAFIGGFSITIGTTLLITQLIAKLNIVSAIRNTPVPKVRFKLITLGWKLFGVFDAKNNASDGSSLARFLSFILDKLVFWGTIMVLAGTGTLVLGFRAELVWPVFVGASFAIIGLGMVIRYFISERLTYNIVASLILFIYIIPTPEPVNSFGADLEMFIISGVFMVSAGVLLLVWNTDIILWVVEKIVCTLKFSPASIKMAISYPIKKRFRTGVTIFMFALIIFTITTMSMIVHVFNINIEEFESSVGGGYDIIGVSNTAQISDMEATLAGTNVSDDVNWDRTVSLTNGLLLLNITLPFGGGYQEVPTNCGGIPDKFIETNGYGFNEVAWDIIDPDDTMEHTDRNAWNALKQSADYVIVDSSFGESGFVGMGMGGTVSAGENITVSSLNGTQYNKTVIGISKLLGFRSVFLYESYAEKEFNAREKNLHLISVKSGQNTRDVANDLRKELVLYGFYAIVVKETIEEILTVQNNFFNLFNAFLSLGLIIGIVGLGIVTLRSVYERRHEIGMMRAIGFKRRSVVLSFLGESTFIAGSGLLIGAILGTILGWILWRDGLSELFPKFGVPVVNIVLIVAVALIFALLSAIAPSLKAARVIPAEALRYE
ncbi:MAG: ABC transporter permease [Thermoplasmatota archaeon]